MATHEKCPIAALVPREIPMDLKSWEPTVAQILAESNRQSTESGKQKVLMAWRAKLGNEPTALLPFQIDKVVREVRRRLDAASRNAA